VWRSIFGIPAVDRMLQRRAKDLYHKVKMGDYLRGGGRYLDIGSGSGHMMEQVLDATDHLPQVRCVGVDPFWRPTNRVADRLRKYPAGKVEFIRAGGERVPWRTARSMRRGSVLSCTTCPTHCNNPSSKRP